MGKSKKLVKLQHKYIFSLIKNHWSDIVFIFIIFSIFTLLLIQNFDCRLRNLNEDFICLMKNYDHPIHFLRSVEFSQITYSRSSIFSWNPNTHLGYPTFLTYSPLAYSLTFLIDFLMKNLSFSYNFTIFLTYLLIPISIYLCLRTLRVNPFLILFTIILLLFYTDFHAKIILLGFWPTYLSIIFIPLTLIALVKKVVFLPPIFLALSFLIHPVSSLNVFLLVVSFYISNIILKKEKINEIKNFVISIVLFFGLVSWWFIPLLFNIKYLNPISTSSSYEGNVYFKELINGQFISYFILFYGILGLALSFYKITTIKLSLFISIILNILISVNYFASFEAILFPVLRGFMEFNRFKAGLPIFLLLLGAFGADSLIKERKNKFENRKLLQIFAFFTIVYLMITSSISLSRITNFYNELIFDYKSSIREQLSKDLSSILGFLNNYDGNCRVSYYHLNSKFDPTIGNLIALDMRISKEEWESLFYNNPNPSNPEDMKMLNVKYIITDDQFKIENDTNFILLKRVGDFSLFELQNYNCSFAFLSNKEIKVTDVEIGKEKMIFEIENGKKGEKILIKSTYFPAWKAYVDEKEVKIEKYQNWNLMEVTLPKDGNYRLYLEYSSLRGEALGLFVTLFSIFLTFFVYLKIKTEASSESNILSQF